MACACTYWNIVLHQGAVMAVWQAWADAVGRHQQPVVTVPCACRVDRGVAVMRLQCKQRQLGQDLQGLFNQQRDVRTRGDLFAEVVFVVVMLVSRPASAVCCDTADSCWPDESVHHLQRCGCAV